MSGTGANSKRSEPWTELKETPHDIPILAVRVYHGGPSSVLVNLAYYYHYGFHRCNLAQDTELEEGVYAYVDIETALFRINSTP